MMKSKIVPPLLTNGIVCAIIGAAFGSYGGMLTWIIGGFILGVILAAAWEAIFHRLAHRPRLFRLRPLLLVLVDFLLVLFLVIPLYGGWHNAHPQRVAVTITPQDIDMAYEEVQLTTSDGIRLAGWYIPSQNGAAIIALHGFSGNRTHVLPHTTILQQAGYGVLLYDIRAMGESSGEVYHYGWKGELDVAPAIEFLLARPDVDAERIGILGLSSGGMTALNAAAKLSELRAIVVDGVEANRMEDLLNPMPPSYRQFWFMAPIPWMIDRATMLFNGVVRTSSMDELLAQISPRPVLFIASGAESEIFQGQKFVAAHPENVSLWEIPEAKHVEGVFVREEEYAAHMLEFFEDNLK
ncbi:MAG: alpha/beta fold hydrolase [Anaerolineales bacterium]|nr:alpha/beta fold hydrolase [Anaerolineales bacterium]